MPFVVVKGGAHPQKTQRQVAEIVVDAYWNDISPLCDDRKKMTEALRGCFLLEHFYVAYHGENPVGVAACCPPGSRAVKVDGTHVRRVLGDQQGTAASEIMKREFESPHDFGPDSGYVEFVATAETARGKGVASLLTRTMLEEEPYGRFVLEVTDANTAAIRLYEKLGFAAFKRIPEESPQSAGFHHRIYMEYIRKG